MVFMRNIKEGRRLVVCLLGDGRRDIFEIGVDMICLVTCFLHSEICVLRCQSQGFEESSENECLLTERARDLEWRRLKGVRLVCMSLMNF